MMNDRARMRHARSSTLALCAALALAGCASPKVAPPRAEPARKPPVVAQPPAKPAPATEPPVKPPVAAATAASYDAVAWSDLPGWRADDVAQAWRAFLASCSVLRARDHWRETCAAAAQLARPDANSARAFFEQRFTPWRVAAADSGADEGLVTGYYEPLLRGSRTRTARYRHPVYGVPDDLVTVDLAEVHPQLKGLRLRGRLDGRRLVPYPDRAAIEGGHAPLRGRELVWVDDEIDLFFLQIQGSGRVQLESGEVIRVGYADQNGHPYRSIGRLLVERGELTLDEASMQGIKGWVRKNPSAAAELLNSNPSYVFFREVPGTADGPLGALGVPLTPERSIAADPAYVPLGAPVFIATTWPNSARPLHRLMLAQDTGGAIRGPVRADFFWGFGSAAGEQAGRMKQRLRVWILLPREHPAPGS